MRVLFDAPHVRLTADDVERLVVYERTAVPYESIAAFERDVAALAHALAPIDRASHALLMDLRASPARNDPEFESVALRLRREMHHGFARVAVLVRTRAGMLQILRHSREHPEDGPPHGTFLEEHEALTYVRQR